MIKPASPKFVLEPNETRINQKLDPEAAHLSEVLRRSKTLLQDRNSQEQADKKKKQAESGRKRVDLWGQRREKQIRDRRV